MFESSLFRFFNPRKKDYKNITLEIIIKKEYSLIGKMFVLGTSDIGSNPITPSLVIFAVCAV